MQAKLGNTVLAVDMHGEGDGNQASHPEDAGRFAGEIRKNMPLHNRYSNDIAGIL